jgi:hypothetical protein
MTRWKARLEAALRGGEVFGLYFMTALLVVVEFCFVYWLHHVQIPDTGNRAEAGFITMPPWYQKPRFEVTLLLTILAGMVFCVCRGLWHLWRNGMDTASRQHALELVRQRLTMATAFAALTALDLALFTLLQG